MYSYDRLADFFIRIPFIMLIYLFSCLIKYYVYKYFFGNRYLATYSIMRYLRISGTQSELYDFITVRKIIEDIKNDCILSNDSHGLRAFYSESSEASAYFKEFKAYGVQHQLRLKLPRQNESFDRQGDLLILKPYIDNNEKGTIFVQYNESFKKFFAIFDVSEISKYYRIVLEPSWWGYQDPIFFSFLGLDTEVIVESQSEKDFKFIKSLKSNLHPIRIGAGDWVDFNVFKDDPRVHKRYDLIMIASWLKLKRHALLFNALRKIKQSINRVALVGYPADGRTKEDIIIESRKYSVDDVIDIFENIKPHQVGELLRCSKVSVMLSKREGANKGIYESIFSNTPVILTRENVGVNREHINKFTGILAGDDELPERLYYMLNSHLLFAPRQWALENTGYQRSTERLNNMLKEVAIRRGESWTRDIYTKKNFTNAIYVYENERIEADKDICHLLQFLRR